jgi:hypothetical protein
MTDQIDQLDRPFLESMHRRAAAPLDTSALLAGAQRRARRLRVRTYAARGLGGVLALVLAAGGVYWLGDDLAGPIDAGEASNGAPLDTPHPPVAEGAAADAKAIGTDPMLIHFSVADLVTDSELTVWQSVKGVERVHFKKNGRWGEVAIAQTEEPLNKLRDWHTVTAAGDQYIPEITLFSSALGEPDAERDLAVGGKPATLYWWRDADKEFAYLRWQPADGVWAQVSSSFGNAADTQGVRRIAEALRLDTVYRCAAPFTLTWVPAAMPLTSCRLALWHRGAFERFDSDVIFGDWSSAMEVSATPSAAPSHLKALHYRVGGKVVPVPASSELKVEVTAGGDGGESAVPKTDRDRLVHGVQVARDVDLGDMSSWPAEVLP